MEFNRNIINFKKNNMIGEKLSPVLVEIESTLWEFEYYIKDKPNYTIDGFRAILKIFTSAIMDKMWELQEKENMELEDREQMAVKLGNELRNLILTYTNIDSYELNKK